MRFIADAIADPLTGLAAALAVVELLEAGGRFLADAALSRVAKSATGGWLQLPETDAYRPRPRRDLGAAMPLGRDTTAVLASLGVH